MMLTLGLGVIWAVYAAFDRVWPDPDPPTFEPYEFPEDREF